MSIKLVFGIEAYATYANLRVGCNWPSFRFCSRSVMLVVSGSLLIREIRSTSLPDGAMLSYKVIKENNLRTVLRTKGRYYVAFID